MSQRKAVYAGSFDPPTNGHLDVIRRAAALFDELHIVIAVNPAKPSRFAPEERLRMLRESLGDRFPNVILFIETGRLIADVAAERGARTIVRGARDAADWAYEGTVEAVNREIAPAVDTIYFRPLKDLEAVSSGMVMGLIGFRGGRPQLRKYVPAPVYRTIVEGFARKRLEADLEGVDAGYKFDLVWDEVRTRYSEPHRHYHTLEHVLDVLEELEGASCASPYVRIAAWFHDIVHFGRADDEEKSAAFATELMRPTRIPYIAALVKATARGGVGIEDADPWSSHARHLVDADHAILGSTAERYDEYARNIREEYRQYTDEEFIIGRQKFLRTLLERPSVYRTEHFRRLYEEKARANIQRELASLESSQGAEQ